MLVKVSKSARYFSCPVCGQQYELDTDEFVNVYGVTETLVCISPEPCDHLNSEYEEVPDGFIFYFKGGVNDEETP
jgi:transcription elongation factor Elf1